MNFLIGHVFSLMALVSSLRIMEGPPLNCTQEGLRCSANISDCSDGDRWVRPRYETSTSPSKSELQVVARRDEKGDLVPVISAKWWARTDGSIFSLKGTKVHIRQEASNQSLCVYYVFHNKMEMVNPRHEAWSFSLDRVVVDPGQKYSIYISNLPVPRIGHNKIDQNFTVPGCNDPKLQETEVCLESGSLWEPNITRSVSGSGAAMTVSFNSEEHSEKYTVSVQCPDFRDSQTVWKENETSLNVTFAMDQWPATCCDYDIVIQPFFIRCSEDCARLERFKNCVHDPGYCGGQVLIISFLGLLLCCGCFALCRKTLTGVRKPCPPGSLSDPAATPTAVSRQEPLQLSTPRKVLLIYSLDHPLYRDVVLKLCAFLRAKCGTEVVLDLLDSAWLGTVGRMQWLDWQKQQIEKSSDKILILCSRGVRAKWRAMCGEGRVMLREDLRSPMGDMLTPALNLIVPDVVHSTSFQKYMVAYFEDVSCEDDVPAPFNVTVKYKLMKHFEELYFRILDQEKHEPGRVNRIEGIALDEYFNCPSGRALRDAIETLQAYQLENPDWFEKECVDSEEEVSESELQHPLLADTCGGPIFQCVPEFQEGPPVLVNEVEFNEDARGVRALIPLVNQGGEGLSTHQLHPGVHPSDSHLCYSHPVVEADPLMSKWSLRPSASEGQPCSRNAAAPQEPPTPMRNTFHLPGEVWGSSSGESVPVENRDEAPTSTDRLSPTVLRQLQALQRSFGPAEDLASAPVGVVDHRKRPPSGSDQGYISRSSHHQDSTHNKSQNPLDALTRLQEACLLNSLKPSGDVPSSEASFGHDRQ
ncbi:interleukin-17 receptor A-like [Anguilla anguilla]|uniref:interleukin-17 receptor A-like n=1 Tax=Anguilla anguilla TaxID=7936 RepID=UPI0015B30187|nr:interleukin-17 receptor A-like [Anguilla anguilla]